MLGIHRLAFARFCQLASDCRLASNGRHVLNYTIKINALNGFYRSRLGSRSSERCEKFHLRAIQVCIKYTIDAANAQQNGI